DGVIVRGLCGSRTTPPPCQARGFRSGPQSRLTALLPVPRQHQLLDRADRLGGVESLRAGARAVHDGVAAVQLERILEVVQARAGVLVAAVGNPAVGLEQDRRAEVALAV